MHFLKSQQSSLALLVLIFFTSTIFAQSKMEYGIGIGILYSDYHEINNLPDGFEFDIDEARISPSINAYAAYRVAEKTKITTSPGMNFLLHNEPYTTRNLSSMYLHLPIGAQHRILGNLSLMGDVFYDFLLNQSYEYRGEHGSFTDRANTKNLFGASAGLAYSIGRYAEIQLTASQHFNAVNTFPLTGAGNIVLGDVKLKNRFLKLNLVFRG